MPTTDAAAERHATNSQTTPVMALTSGIVDPKNLVAFISSKPRK